MGLEAVPGRNPGCGPAMAWSVATMPLLVCTTCSSAERGIVVEVCLSIPLFLSIHAVNNQTMSRMQRMQFEQPKNRAVISSCNCNPLCQEIRLLIVHRNPSATHP